MKLVAAVKKYFGLRSGETLSDFAKEYRELTSEDLAEIKQGLIDEGYDIAE